MTSLVQHVCFNSNNTIHIFFYYTIYIVINTNILTNVQNYNILQIDIDTLVKFL